MTRPAASPRPASLAERMGEVEKGVTEGPWRPRRALLDPDAPHDPPACWGIAAGSEQWKRNLGHFHPADAVYAVDELNVVEIGYDRAYHFPEAAIPRREDAAFIARSRNLWPLLTEAVEAAEGHRKAAGAVERDFAIFILDAALARLAAALDEAALAASPAEEGRDG